MKYGSEESSSSTDGIHELSFASRVIKDGDLHKEPAYIQHRRNGFMLYVCLVPNTEGMHVAATMEDEYRTEANNLAANGEIERAKQVVEEGYDDVEGYIKEQWCGQRLMGSVGIYGDIANLEAQRDAILDGSQSPMPARSTHMSSQTVVLSGSAGELL